ncbi:hypothetical protein K5D53_25000 [Pseudomonas cichorii]|nr:hypothetical protein [Pseudomonas cichorii]MBX8599000.1 hypothetical protein [Pseudomonas cichorii]MBX8619086.1 hypothetical protein [Pseudomonas cichorii]
MIMKSFLTIFAALLVACLYIGFYEKMEDAYPEKIFFFKKAPTFQVRFENIFAYESDDKKLSELSDTERQQVIQYCKYRLGVTTTLKNQNELEECKKR